MNNIKVFLKKKKKKSNNMVLNNTEAEKQKLVEYRKKYRMKRKDLS